MYITLLSVAYKEINDYLCVVFEILGLKLYPANRFVSKVVENSWMKLNTLHYYLNYFVMIHALDSAYSKCLKDLLGADHYLYLYLCVPLHVPLCCKYLQSNFLHIVRKMDPNISAFIWLLISTSTRRQASSLSQLSSQPLSKSPDYPYLVTCSLWGREVAP